MVSVASRDLRNHTADVLRRVAAGERVVVTVHGEPVAELVPPVRSRPRFLRKQDLAKVLSRSAADPGLREDLAELAGETTDDLGGL